MPSLISSFVWALFFFFFFVIPSLNCKCSEAFSGLFFGHTYSRHLIPSCDRILKLTPSLHPAKLQAEYWASFGCPKGGADCSDLWSFSQAHLVRPTFCICSQPSFKSLFLGQLVVCRGACHMMVVLCVCVCVCVWEREREREREIHGALRVPVGQLGD